MGRAWGDIHQTDRDAKQIVNAAQEDLAHWLREFDYSRDFFAPTERTSTLLAYLAAVRLETDLTKKGVADLLLAYREHAQELLKAIVELEKIVG